MRKVLEGIIVGSVLLDVPVVCKLSKSLRLHFCGCFSKHKRYKTFNLKGGESA